MPTCSPTPVPVTVACRSGPNIGDGEGHWTPIMKARAPYRWRRWTAEWEHGAWFAGEWGRGGVVALPGGRALTLVTVE